MEAVEEVAIFFSQNYTFILITIAWESTRPFSYSSPTLRAVSASDRV